MEKYGNKNYADCHQKIPSGTIFFAEIRPKGLRMGAKAGASPGVKNAYFVKNMTGLAGSRTPPGHRPPGPLRMK